MNGFYRTASWLSVPSFFLFLVVTFGIAGLWAHQNVNSEHRWYHDERSSQWWACQDARGFLVRQLPNGEVRDTSSTDPHRRKNNVATHRTSISPGTTTV